MANFASSSGVRCRVTIGGLCLVMIACGPPESWRPRPPSGVTYRYEDQGFVRARQTVVGGASGGVGYAAAFGFREGIGANGGQGKDPFEQAKAIDGVHFNEHLGAQGVQLSPEGASVTPAPPAPDAATQRSAR
jgi:hypothetical protein